ncbi:acid-resistance protein HdeD [Vibrio sp. MACH09]|uniref:HdeD family acid-resistance protein n=1 Tax=unclassified Vibrio TaxID=2614977 RepID=UPI00149334EE|nr:MULTISPECIES: DUF308 domain-containing protein [unclassified Vibrio]NOI67349.1 hypothetical protein [Vibrio sp. 99-8-1]GLO63965.1 acid-resistance protein HdeD [Vibrio sp. MACH09]
MKSRKLILLAGVISLLGGLLALYNPAQTSLTLEQLLGWTFIVSGVFNLVGGFKYRNEHGIWTILLAIFTLILGYFFIRMPLESVLSLASFVILLLFGSGVTQIAMAFKRRGSSSFIPVFVSGLISLSLSLIFLLDFPRSAELLLGVLFAIELISNGISLIVFAWAAKKVSGECAHG